MADKRAYFKVDVGYLMNPKIAKVAAKSPTAILLHLESIAYSTQHLTDGKVPISFVMRLVGATEDDADLLLESGLWTADGPDQAEVHDYLEHQRSALEVKGAAAQATRAAQARWSTNDADSVPDASSSAMQTAMLGALPDAKQTAMPREREREREKEQAASFEIWWSMYPRKTAKATALKAYKGALKKVDADTLIYSLKEQLPYLNAGLKPDGDFRPMPSTWLNGERWADRPSQVTPIRTRSAATPEGW